jgi:hypothetical protein
MIELTSKDLFQIASFVVVGGGVLWRFSSLLGEIKSDLKLINQQLEQIAPKLDDHEARIRALEKACLASHGSGSGTSGTP